MGGGLNVQILCGERIYMKKIKISKKAAKKSNFQDLLTVQKLQFFPFYVQKTEFKNDQDVCWLEKKITCWWRWLSETSPRMISTWPLKLVSTKTNLLFFSSFLQAIKNEEITLVLYLNSCLTIPVSFSRPLELLRVTPANTWGLKCHPKPPENDNLPPFHFSLRYWTVEGPDQLGVCLLNSHSQS